MSDATGEQAVGMSPVLAIYDFRSKQEFIYRTNRMKEIAGASLLIANMYGAFLKREKGKDGGGKRLVAGKPFIDDWKSGNPTQLFDKNEMPIVKALAGKAGAVVYEGGGNLLMLYPDEEAYMAANRVFSHLVIKDAYSLSMIAAHVAWKKSAKPDVSNFEYNRRRVYNALDRYKRIGGAAVPCNVLPYTLVDRTTFQPIVEREPNKDTGELVEHTREAAKKLKAYKTASKEWKEAGKYIDDLGTEKGKDSLVAVLYFDGNSIGERLKTAVEDGKKGGKTALAAMRDFSQELHSILVEATERAMKGAIEGLEDERYRGCRVIIDHGDEITLICNAHAAPFAVEAYFDALKKANESHGTEYQACGGVAFCHSHDPFAEVYRIAEECCESGKKKNREGLSRQGSDRSFIDFHFCRSGITGSLKQIREAQEGTFIARPYVIGDSYSDFIEIGCELAKSDLQRSDIKALNRAILEGDSWYLLEWERLKAKDKESLGRIEAMIPDDTERKKVIFDVVSMWDVFDLRFQA